MSDPEWITTVLRADDGENQTSVFQENFSRVDDAGPKRWITIVPLRLKCISPQAAAVCATALFEAWDLGGPVLVCDMLEAPLAFSRELGVGLCLRRRNPGLLLHGIVPFAFVGLMQ